MKRVIVLGGGMGGLAAAQELVNRGFEVEVYEKLDQWGGKARSMERWSTGRDGRRDLPGEHGFRFFPGFYKHVTASMRGVSVGEGRTAFDNLTIATEVAMAQTERPNVQIPLERPRTLQEWIGLLDLWKQRGAVGIPGDQLLFFAHQMLDLMTTCRERRFAELDDETWWNFIDAEKYGEQYRKLLATGLTRSLVAMRAEVACARTVGDMLVQMLVYAIVGDTDRVLNGPTSDVWITPWIEQLRKAGVTLIENASVREFLFDGRTITGVRIDVDGREQVVEGDYYVSAVPVDVMAPLVTPEMKGAAPSLARLGKLQVQWMNGIVFYLRRDVPIVHGHMILADSPWALTAISQAQFWKPVDFGRFGAGRTQDVFSVDISNWNQPGDQVVKKMARDCSALEVATEAWAQIRAHFAGELSDEDLIAPLDDPEIRSWFLDPDIDTRPNELCGAEEAGSPSSQLRDLVAIEEIDELLAEAESGAAEAANLNFEPLLVNTMGSWQNRPEATTEIPNLFLASDYVKTYTDLATMEGANEAGRRAVNGILAAAGSDAPPCKVWPLEELRLFAPFRALDKLLFRLGIPSIRWSPLLRLFHAISWIRHHLFGHSVQQKGVNRGRLTPVDHPLDQTKKSR